MKIQTHKLYKLGGKLCLLQSLFLPQQKVLLVSYSSNWFKNQSLNGITETIKSQFKFKVSINKDEASQIITKQLNLENLIYKSLICMQVPFYKQSHSNGILWWFSWSLNRYPGYSFHVTISERAPLYLPQQVMPRKQCLPQ